LSLAEKGVSSISDVAIVDDSTIAVTRTVHSAERDPARATLLLLVDSRTGVIRRDALRVPTASANNPHPGGEFLSMCATTREGEPTLVIGQLWLMQTVVLDAEALEARANFVTLSEWGGGVRPEVPGRPEPQLRPRFRRNQVACLADGVVTWTRKVNWDAVPPEDMGSLLEYRDYDGRAMYRGSNPPFVDPNARPVASWRNNVVFVSNVDVPEVVVVGFERNQ
jgi:hypothetical protein